MTTEPDSRALRALVCDDSADNLELMRQFLTSIGHIMVTAHTGEEAIQLFSESPPDLVLMDMMLPGIDGTQTVSRIRELAGERWVPMIFMSALNDPKDIVRALDAGGDDYVTKPINLRLLAAKLRAMVRISVMQARLEETTRELTIIRQLAEEELEMARTIVEHIQHAEQTLPQAFASFNQPADRVSGDLTLARTASNGDTYLMHADAMGHGLPAALPLLIIAPIFNRMVEQGHVVSAIVREMNRRLHQLMPRGNFIAATIARVDPRNRVIELWNGGSPPVVVIAEDGTLAARLDAAYLSLGILDDQRIETQVTVRQLAGPARLLLYSDGLAEVLDAEGSPLSLDAVITALGPPKPANDAAAAIKRLRNLVTQHLNGGHAHDDMSCAILDF